jgi:Polyketide cyclase / dehydrase and lipid transport
VDDPFQDEHVASVTRAVAASPADVWSVLADGWLYATWVVGASRIRAVDPGWPATGTSVHHSFGVWPLVINDDTAVLGAEPERELVLRAKGWPLGEAIVRLTLTPRGPDTVLTLQEDATAGPGRLVPRPVRQLGVAPRNKESLRRLGFLAEGRRSTASQ